MTSNVCIYCSSDKIYGKTFVIQVEILVCCAVNNSFQSVLLRICLTADVSIVQLRCERSEIKMPTPVNTLHDRWRPYVYVLLNL